MEQEAPREPPKIVVQGGVLRCPFCHDEVGPVQSVACRDCLARHHARCWDEGGRCSACRSTHKLVSVSGLAFAKPVAAPPEWARPRTHHAGHFLYLQGVLLLGATCVGFASPALAALLIFVLLLACASYAHLRDLTTSYSLAVVVLDGSLAAISVIAGLFALLWPEAGFGFGVLVGLVSFILGFLDR